MIADKQRREVAATMRAISGRGVKDLTYLTTRQRRMAAAALRSLGRTTMPVPTIVGTVADAYGGRRAGAAGYQGHLFGAMEQQ